MFDKTKLCDILLVVGAAITIIGIECVCIDVMATNGASIFELVCAIIILFGVDLMIVAFFMIE